MAYTITNRYFVHMVEESGSNYVNAFAIYQDAKEFAIERAEETGLVHEVIVRSSDAAQHGSIVFECGPDHMGEKGA